MSSITFDRKVGSETDCKELEYLSFLHQSGIEARTDCSIRDEDIRVFLLSRYGIDVTIDTVRETILHGLGGDDDLDLMELTSILMIPVLLKASIVLDRIGPTSMRTAFQTNNNNKKMDKKESADEYTFDSVDGLPNGVQSPPTRMMEFITKVILHDVTGSSSPKPLTVDMIKNILISYGEHDLANDNELIDEMLSCAHHSTSFSTVLDNNRTDEMIIFDEKTFVRCLTYDVKQYDIENETHTTIATEEFLPPQVHVGENMQRRLHTSYVAAFNSVNEQQNQQQETNNVADPWKRNFTAPAIDITAGTFRSKLLLSLLWTITLMTFGIIYLSEYGVIVPMADCPSYDYGTGWIGNADVVGCATGSTIGKWVITFLAVGLLGLFFTGLGSVGNSIRCRRWFHPLLGCLPFVLILSNRYNNVRDDLKALAYIIIILSCIAICLHLLHVLAMILPEDFVSKRGWLNKLLLPGFHKAELIGKQASAKKLNLMVSNALLLLNQRKLENNIQDTYHGIAIHSYAKCGTWKTEKVGGTHWTWTSIWNETFFSNEGIWLSVRVVASNIGQFVVCIFVLWFGIFWFKTLLDNYDDSNMSAIYNYTSLIIDQNVDEALVNETMSDFLLQSGSLLSQLYDSGKLQLNCTNATTIFNDSQYSVCEDGDIDCLGYGDADSLCLLLNNSTGTSIDSYRALNSSGVDIGLLTNQTRYHMLQASMVTINSLYPSDKYMVSIPLGVALGVAVLTSVFLAITFVPSLTSTVLKLRCGKIPTMHYHDQIRYRVAPHSVAMLTGSLFWGCLVSSVFTGFVCGLVVFFFLWQGTTYYAQRFFALMIAFILIAVIKVLLGCPFRMSVYSGFYRRRPATANVGILALEWANFLVTSAIIGVRMVALTIIALFSVGRIYKPVLADGVGVFGPIEFDGFPTIVLRELLAHEAHRHPYIELLGLIYVMKLKHGNDFATRAGYGWRLIFVHALMPWLQKYRIEKDTMITANKLSNGYVHNDAMQFVSIRRLLHNEHNKNIIQQQEQVLVNESIDMYDDLPHANDNYDDALRKFDERMLQLKNELRKIEVAKEKFELSAQKEIVSISVIGYNEDFTEENIEL